MNARIDAVRREDSSEIVNDAAISRDADGNAFTTNGIIDLLKNEIKDDENIAVKSAILLRLLEVSGAIRFFFPPSACMYANSLHANSIHKRNRTMGDYLSNELYVGPCTIFGCIEFVRPELFAQTIAPKKMQTTTSIHQLNFIIISLLGLSRLLHQRQPQLSQFAGAEFRILHISYLDLWKNMSALGTRVCCFLVLSYLLWCLEEDMPNQTHTTTSSNKLILSESMFRRCFFFLIFVLGK